MDKKRERDSMNFVLLEKVGKSVGETNSTQFVTINFTRSIMQVLIQPGIYREPFKLMHPRVPCKGPVPLH
jgi:hypothetical protein